MRNQSLGFGIGAIAGSPKILLYGLQRARAHIHRLKALGQDNARIRDRPVGGGVSRWKLTDDTLKGMRYPVNVPRIDVRGILKDTAMFGKWTRQRHPVNDR
jgi:hypothetical protein